MSELDVYCPACGQRWTFALVPSGSTTAHTIYSTCHRCSRGD